MKKELEVNKLFKELDYVNADLEYKREYMEEINNLFIQEIGKIIEEREDIGVKDDENKENNKTVDISKVKIKKKIDKRVKDVFRKIAKKTHPDISKDLSEYYVKANDLYNDNDILSLFLLCNELGIKFEFKEEDTDLIRDKIQKVRDSIEFIECSYAWQWNISKTDREKEAIIDLYMKDNF